MFFSFTICLIILHPVDRALQAVPEFRQHVAQVRAGKVVDVAVVTFVDVFTFADVVTFVLDIVFIR